MKNITGFFLSLLFISCQQKNESIPKADIASAKSDTLDKIDIDTTLFCVYNLSKTTTAIVINLNDQNTGDGTAFDKVFNEISSKDSLYNVVEAPKSNRTRNFEYYDTLGSYKLIRSKTLENQIKKITEKSYYVYGTKGFSKITINKVVCGLDECRTNILAFPIENFDTTKNGKPVFCSKQLLKINYQESYFDIQKKVRDYDEEKSKNYDYKDDIKTKIFANIRNTYFTYSDDFLWGRDPENSKCSFPARAIYIVKKNKPVKRFWIEGLDLFGIPCD